jgi:hypothetical protein
VEFKVGQHMWLNIRDLKMSDGLTSCFHTKYVRLYEIVAKLHFDVHTLKLLISFVAHMTISVSKLKLFMRDENRPY